MIYFYCLILIGIGLTILWIRLAPSPVSKFHEDPSLVESRGLGQNSYLVSSSDLSDQEPVKSGLPAIEVATIIDSFLLSELNAKLLSAQDFETYIVRSKWFGFPDYISLKVSENGTGALVEIYSRSWFGIRDFGVNKDHVQKILDQIPT